MFSFSASWAPRVIGLVARISRAPRRECGSPTTSTTGIGLEAEPLSLRLFAAPEAAAVLHVLCG